MLNADYQAQQQVKKKKREKTSCVSMISFLPNCDLATAASVGCTSVAYFKIPLIFNSLLASERKKSLIISINSGFGWTNCKRFITSMAWPSSWCSSPLINQSVHHRLCVKFHFIWPLRSNHRSLGSVLCPFRHFHFLAISTLKIQSRNLFINYLYFSRTLPLCVPMAFIVLITDLFYCRENASRLTCYAP